MIYNIFLVCWLLTTAVLAQYFNPNIPPYRLNRLLSGSPTIGDAYYPHRTRYFYGYNAAPFISNYGRTYRNPNLLSLRSPAFVKQTNLKNDDNNFIDEPILDKEVPIENPNLSTGDAASEMPQYGPLNENVSLQKMRTPSSLPNSPEYQTSKEPDLTEDLEKYPTQMPSQNQRPNSIGSDNVSLGDKQIPLQSDADSFKADRSEMSNVPKIDIKPSVDTSNSSAEPVAMKRVLGDERNVLKNDTTMSNEEIGWPNEISSPFSYSFLKTALSSDVIQNVLKGAIKDSQNEDTLYNSILKVLTKFQDPNPHQSTTAMVKSMDKVLTPARLARILTSSVERLLTDQGQLTTTRALELSKIFSDVLDYFGSFVRVDPPPGEYLFLLIDSILEFLNNFSLVSPAVVQKLFEYLRYGFSSLS